MRSEISIDTDYGVFLYILYKSNVTRHSKDGRKPRVVPEESQGTERTVRHDSQDPHGMLMLQLDNGSPTGGAPPGHCTLGARGGAVRALCYTLLPPIERRLDSSATCPSSFASTCRHVRVQPPATSRRPRLQCRQQRRRPATARSRQADRYAPQDYLGVRCVPL